MEELDSHYGRNYGKKINDGFSTANLGLDSKEDTDDYLHLRIKDAPPTYKNGKQVFIPEVEQDTRHAELARTKEDSEKVRGKCHTLNSRSIHSNE